MAYNKQIKNKREQLKSVMDDFTTFRWGEPSTGSNAFDEFGAFIVGGKDALKFYNGSSFSNKYITTQFQSNNTTLESVEFKTMTVSFTMGVYWFTIEEYRKILQWLHPYEIKDLSFSFAPKWFYTAKLSTISDSPRYVLGKDEYGQERYYTEIKLTFDIQGEPCVYNYDEYVIQESENSTNGKKIYVFNNTTSMVSSDLDTPFTFMITMEPTTGGLFPSKMKWPSKTNLYPQAWDRSSENEDELSSTAGYYIALEVNLKADGISNSELVFEAFLKNLSWQDTAGASITFTYDSAQGLLLIGNEGKLLTSQTTVFSGKRILEALSIYPYKLPGVLESGISESDFKQTQFILHYSTNWSPINFGENNFEGRARTNVI